MPTRPAAILTFVSLLALGGCEVVGGILAVGFWAGVIIVVVAVLVIWLVLRAFRR